MKSQFSEFTYGFSITNELLYYSRCQSSRAPIFPSLLEEGREGGGYDMACDFNGMPIFLQFKLSEFLCSNSAREMYLFRQPYYRFSLMPLKFSNQHNMLINLELSGELVYYAAPKFHTIEELNNYFLESAIIDNSIFISPFGIGYLPDEYEHRIVFDGNTNHIYRCSTAKAINTAVEYDLINKLKKCTPKKISKKYLIKLAKKMEGIIRDNIKNSESLYKSEKLEEKHIDLNKDPIKYIEYLSMNFFGCIFTIIYRE